MKITVFSNVADERIKNALNSIQQQYALNFDLIITTTTDSFKSFPYFYHVWLIYLPTQTEDFARWSAEFMQRFGLSGSVFKFNGDLDFFRIWSNEKIREIKFFDLSLSDEVTGLYNHRKLRMDLERLVADNLSFSLLFIDIDEFKKVNDGHGHIVGTRVLHHMARILDTMKDQTKYLYRYGGDEFVVILPLVRLDNAFELATNLSEKIKSIKFEVGNLSVSIGISEYPNDAKTTDDILQFADQMMYVSKKRGRGKIIHRKIHEESDALPSCKMKKN